VPRAACGNPGSCPAECRFVLADLLSVRGVERLAIGVGTEFAANGPLPTTTAPGGYARRPIGSSDIHSTRELAYKDGKRKEGKRRR
jgi:hypothetical protein